MNISKSIQNFLYEYKQYIDKNEWNTVFRAASDNNISIFSLAKLLVNAGIDFNFNSKYMTGKLIDIFKQISTTDFLEIADLELKYGHLELRNINNTTYIELTAPFDDPKFMLLDDFYTEVYIQFILDLEKYSSYHYDYLFLHYNIDAHNDPSVKNIMLDKPTTLPKQPIWKSIEDLY